MLSENASYLLPKDKKESVMKWFSDQIDANAKPLSDLKRREVVLFPPGKCVHFYRDGVGISAVSPWHAGEVIAASTSLIPYKWFHSFYC
jgi:hypothetical protein